MPVDENLLLAEIRQPAVGDFDWDDFVSVPFTHHVLILSKAKSPEERLFYIHECRVIAWNKYTLSELPYAITGIRWEWLPTALWLMLRRRYRRISLTLSRWPY